MKPVHAYRPPLVPLPARRLAVNAIALVLALVLALGFGGRFWFTDRGDRSVRSVLNSAVAPADSSGQSSERVLESAPGNPPLSTVMGDSRGDGPHGSLTPSSSQVPVRSHAVAASLRSPAAPSQNDSGADASRDDDTALFTAWDRLEQRIASGINRARESVVALEYAPSDAAPGTRRLATGVVISHRGDVLSIRIDRPAATSAAGDIPDPIIARDSTGRRHGVRWIASDAQTGLTLLRISSRALRPIHASKNEPELGSQVFVVGNPFGMEHSVSRGHVAGLERTLDLGSRTLGGLIQIQTPLYPGDSGAVVVNLRGEWLGMIRSGLAIPSASVPVCADQTVTPPAARPISAQVSEPVITDGAAHGRFHSDPDSGFGFAIPSRDALWVAEQLRRDGRVNRAYLGIRLELGETDRLAPTPPPSLAAEFGPQGVSSDVLAAWSAIDPASTKITPSSSDGAVVREVLPKTPAAACGLRAGDCIVSLDGMPIHSAHDLTDRVDHISTRAVIKLIVMRPRGTKTDRVELALETASRPETLSKSRASLPDGPAISVTPTASSALPGDRPPLSKKANLATTQPQSVSPDRLPTRDPGALPDTLRQTLPPEVVRRLQELEARLEKLEHPPDLKGGSSGIGSPKP